jgi:hypothetical protein
MELVVVDYKENAHGGVLAAEDASGGNQEFSKHFRPTT